MEAPTQEVTSSEQVLTCEATTKRPTTERKRDYLCDLTLLVKDGKQFRAHKDLLSEASPFFEKLLQSGMKESKEGVVRLEVLTEPLMEDILQFIYTGGVQISTRERAEDLITAADYLCVLPLKTVAQRFLKQELTTANCISTHHFAEIYHCEELLTNSRKFILEKNVKVSKSKEFLNLERKEIERWISSDDVPVTAEEDVFDMILRWIDQNKSHRMGEFNELFRHLRLVFMSRDYLSRHLVTNRLVKENVGCLNLVLDTVKWIDSAKNGDLPHRPRKGLEVDALVAKRCRDETIWFYVPDKGKWIQSPNALPTGYCRVVSCRGRLFAFSREDPFEAFLCERYDPFFNRWTPLAWTAPPAKPRGSRFATILVIREDIYITVLSGSEIISLYRYDIESDSWEIISFSSDDTACLVVEDKRVYALGGFFQSLGRGITAEAKRFDISEKKWETIAELQQTRCFAFGAAAHGKIYVAGGWPHVHNTTMLQTVEMYNILTNEWQFIASLTVPRLNGSMVCVGETLYVLGGDGCRFPLTCPVECYDPENNEWYQATTVLHRKVFPSYSCCGAIMGSSFKGCSTKLLRPVVDKLERFDFVKRSWLPRLVRKRK